MGGFCGCGRIASSGRADVTPGESSQGAEAYNGTAVVSFSSSITKLAEMSDSATRAINRL